MTYNPDDWKPGDIALVTVSDDGITGGPATMVMTRGANLWKNHEKGFWSDAYVMDVRNLLVIDPEDRDQVERLRDLVASVCPYSAPHGVGEMQDALRAMLQPARLDGPPQEPGEARERRLRARIEALADTWEHVPDSLLMVFIQRLRANLEETP